MTKVCDEVICAFKSATETDEVGGNACGNKLFIGHLTMGCIGGMQTATSCICHVGFNGDKAQTLHKLLCSLSSALYAETDNATSAVGAILFGKVVIFVPFKVGVSHPVNKRMILQKFCHFFAVFNVTCHTDVEAFKAEVDIKCVLR